MYFETFSKDAIKFLTCAFEGGVQVAEKHKYPEAIFVIRIHQDSLPTITTEGHLTNPHSWSGQVPSG